MQSSDKWTPENDAASLEPHSQGDLADLTTNHMIVTLQIFCLIFFGPRNIT